MKPVSQMVTGFFTYTATFPQAGILFLYISIIYWQIIGQTHA